MKLLAFWNIIILKFTVLFKKNWTCINIFGCCLDISIKIVSFLFLNFQCLVDKSLCLERIMWTWELNSDFYKLPSRYVEKMLELSIFTSRNESVKFAVPSVIKFKARSSKHYFNCGQPVVGYTGASRYHFFLRTCRTWIENIARCFYAPRHPIHARWIKVKWDFLFGNCIAIGVQFVACKIEKKNINLFSFFFFLCVQKTFFSRWDFYISHLSYFSRECNFLFGIYVYFFNITKYSRHVTLKFNERMMSKSIRDRG